MAKLVLPDESYQIIGACFAVYNDKGCGFLEGVYQQCLEIEFAYQRIPFLSHPKKKLFYRGQQLKIAYKPDFLCFDQIIIEIKAAECLCDKHRAQLLNYLNATQLPLGILVNFGHHPKLEYERIAFTRK
jgi:GxxExxY protein